MTRLDTQGRPLEPGRYIIRRGTETRYDEWTSVVHCFGKDLASYTENGARRRLTNKYFDGATFERLDGPEGTEEA